VVAVPEVEVPEVEVAEVEVPEVEVPPLEVVEVPEVEVPEVEVPEVDVAEVEVVSEDEVAELLRLEVPVGVTRLITVAKMMVTSRRLVDAKMALKYRQVEDCVLSEVPAQAVLSAQVSRQT
jgi:hypothetical protein